MPNSLKQHEPVLKRPLLRQSDQFVVAFMLVIALFAMAGYWFLYGGHRGDLIEIDPASKKAPHFLVDINKADWPELIQLPKVGPILAKRIVAHRNAHGKYRGHSSLLDVEGIGPKTLEHIAPFLIPLPEEASMAGAP